MSATANQCLVIIITSFDCHSHQVMEQLYEMAEAAYRYSCWCIELCIASITYSCCCMRLPVKHYGHCWWSHGEENFIVIMVTIFVILNACVVNHSCSMSTCCIEHAILLFLFLSHRWTALAGRFVLCSHQLNTIVPLRMLSLFIYDSATAWLYYALCTDDLHVIVNCKYKDKCAREQCTRIK